MLNGITLVILWCDSSVIDVKNIIVVFYSKGLLSKNLTYIMDLL